MDSIVREYASSPTKVKRFQLIYDAIPNGTESILDVGCARYTADKRVKNDLHGLLVNETDVSVKGIDISKEGIKKMGKEGYDVHLADAQDFNFDKQFDVIVAGEVIEYIPNPGLFFNNAFNHLSDGGRIIVTTENPRAFVHWRTSLQGKRPANFLWIDPENMAELSDDLEQDNIDIKWISPEGGISGLLWRLGYKKSSAPRYCAIIDS